MIIIYHTNSTMIIEISTLYYYYDYYNYYVNLQSSSRKTLIYLILTLNHMYPDYDFSTLRAEDFQKAAVGINRCAHNNTMHKLSPSTITVNAHNNNNYNNSSGGTATTMYMSKSLQGLTGSNAVHNRPSSYQAMKAGNNATINTTTGTGTNSIASVKERVNTMLNDAARVWHNEGMCMICSSREGKYIIKL